MSKDNKQISLIGSERVIMSSTNDELTLTNLRIRHSSAGFGASILTSMTLQSLSCCSLRTKSHPVLLLVAGVLFLAGLSGELKGLNSELLWICIVVLCVAYVLSRRAILSFASSSGQAIVVPAKGMSREQILKFIEAVEQAKLNSAA